MHLPVRQGWVETTLLMSSVDIQRGNPNICPAFCDRIVLFFHPNYCFVKLFLKAVKAEAKIAIREKRAGLVRGGSSPLGGIARLADREENAASSTGQLLLLGHVFALQLEAYLSFQHLSCTCSTIWFINTQCNNFIRSVSLSRKKIETHLPSAVHSASASPVR